MPQSDPQTPPPDAEMTPEAAEVISRARRTFGVAVAVLLLGFIAIGGALVYRATRDDNGSADRYTLETVNLPAGAEVISVTAGDGLVTLTYRLGAATRVKIVDGRSAEAVGQFVVATE